jgi:hypothetical protein
MHLVEILLPIFGNEGDRFPEAKFTAVRAHLRRRFGGVTAFMHSPAHGTSQDGGKVQHDDIVIMEVMTENLDRDWWSTYRRRLERDFAQDEIVIRATGIDRF